MEAKNIGRQVSAAKAALAGKATPHATAKVAAPGPAKVGGSTAISIAQAKKGGR